MRDILSLCKPRIAVMVVITAGIGAWLAGGGPGAAWAVAGAGLASCASGCLNQWLEQEPDSRMRRTRSRPLPSGRVSPGRALALGISLGAAGLSLLAWKSNLAAFGLTALTMALYLGAYTPLKKVTPHCTWLGSIAGALPPVIGWAAVRGGIGPGALALFAIQFLWQIPHFLAMFWLHREDYAAAGFKVAPVVDPEGGLTACQIALYSFAVLPASLLPSLCGLAGLPYAIGALVLGTAYLALGMRASWTLAALDARRLFLASLAYLPLLFGMLVLGGA